MRSTWVLGSLVLVVGAAAQQPIIIDDSLEYSPSYPTGIQYFGENWLTNNTHYNHLRYNQSSHASRKPTGDGFLFSFRGSAISWYADRGVYNGPLTLQLDGVSTLVSNFASSITFQQELWKSPTLDDGDHQLIVTNNGDDLIGLDSLWITPLSDSNDIRSSKLGPGASSVPPDAILVDDSDPSISCSGSGWVLIRGGYMQNSTRMTPNPGDSCTFTFTGTQFWYFANDNRQNALVNIDVDGNKMYSGASDTNKFVQKLLWASPGLNYGQHTVTVTHAGNLGDIASVEFFMYLASGSGSSGSSSGGSGGGGGSGSKSVPLGAIIGASVGGAVLLTVLGGLLVLCGARRKRSRLSKVEEAPGPVFEPYPEKEGRVVSGLDASTLNYRESVAESSGYQSPPPTGGAVSGNTNFTAPGYAGYPEVQG